MPAEREPLSSTKSPGRSTRGSSSAAAARLGRPVPFAALGRRRVAGRELADADHDVDAEPRAGAADLGVPARRVGAELGHVAEDGDRAGAAGALDERGQRALDRGRVGVVGVVHEHAAAVRAPAPGRAAARARSRRRRRRARPAAAPRGRRPRRPRPGWRRGGRRAAARSARCARRGRRAPRASRRRPAPRRGSARRRRARRTSSCAGRRAGRARAAARRPAAPRRRPPGRAASSEASSRATPSRSPRNSRCSGAMFVTTPMSGSAMAARSASSPTSLVPSSQMQSACSRLEPEQRQRQAEAVVVVAMGGECRHVRGAERGEHVLRGRLAIRSGDADHLPAPRTPHLAGDGAERRERLVGLEHADARERARAPRAAEHGGRTGGAHGVEVVVPVGALALERAEERSRAGRARVADDALDASGRIAAEQARSLERARRERDHPPPPSSSCATVRSSKGSTTPSDVLALLVALAEDQDEIARLGIGQRQRAIARRRSCSTRASAGSLEAGQDLARRSARWAPSASCRS